MPHAPGSPPPGASAEDLSRLCRACGLCCDGSLFGRADLDAGEVEGARKHRLHVISRGTSFEQPCSALGDAGCGIYDERPRSCRRFSCHLYEAYRREGGPVERPLSVVRRVRTLLAAASPGEECTELTEVLEQRFGRA